MAGKTNDEDCHLFVTDDASAGDYMRMSENQRNRSSTIARGTYRCSFPLVRPSRLTTYELGGIGKNLSQGWCANYAVGCTHGCPFCYVDSIHKRFSVHRYGGIVTRKWGDYLLLPRNFEEAVRRTPWGRWRGIEVMLSSTHDPYIPELRTLTHSVLETALSEGVKFCIQTRSLNVLTDLDLLVSHREQVRIQVSLATSDEDFARIIEPRVPPPFERLCVLREAKESGIRTGVIVAPVFPPVARRPDVRRDLRAMALLIADIKPDYVFGESLHVRGGNLQLLKDVLNEQIAMHSDFDDLVGSIFRGEMKRRGLQATWWPDDGHRVQSEVLQRVPADGLFSHSRSGGNRFCQGRKKIIETGLRDILQT